MREQLPGWRAFAGIVFFLVGAFNVIGGLAALFKDEVFTVGDDGSSSPTTRPGAGSC
jgi:hypothetical protein